jgi:5-methylcytosine-specific restriction enzyme subunit McrC
LSGNHLIVREHQTIRLGPKGPLSRPAYAAFLARIPALPSGVLKPIHEGLRTGSHCGLVQAGPWTLEILPKIYDPEDPLPDRCALVRMLATCFDIPIRLDGTAGSTLADDLLTIVIRAFLEEAQRQLRQGWIKCYVDQEERLTRLRGRLNVSEQVRRGRAAADRLHCVFDELTVDNDLNRVVRAALVLVRPRLPVGSRFAIQANQLDLALAAVGLIGPGQALRMRLPQHRLTRRYDRLLLLASWLLRLLGPNVHGGPEEGLGLTFDMNRLFQETVSIELASAIRRHPLGSRLRLTRERPVKPLVRDESNRPHFMMRPDLCLWLDRELIAILDTKWKQLKPSQEERRAGIAQTDLYQLLGYGYTYACRHLTLIYPNHPRLEGWPLPRYSYCSPAELDIALQVGAFDLDRCKSAADQLLSLQIEGLREALPLGGWRCALASENLSNSSG